MTALSTIKAFTDAAADAVGREIARLRAEAKREDELRAAEYRACTAELETRILAAGSLEKELRERLSTLRDGVDGRDGKDGTDGIGKDGIDGRDGHDVEDISVTQTGPILELGFQVADVRTVFEVELPAGPAGNDGDRGPEGPVGKLTTVKAWADEVHYEGAVRTHAGATWQALRDTAKEPPGDDWICIAERGVDGVDGRSFELREVWSADEEYRALEVVTLNGASFAARKDNPGECPGPDWKLLASQGKRGPPGDRGARGEAGPAGPPVKAMVIDSEGLLTLTNGDGSVVTCDLYPLLAKLSSC